MQKNHAERGPAARPFHPHNAGPMDPARAHKHRHHDRVEKPDAMLPPRHHRPSAGENAFHHAPPNPHHQPPRRMNPPPPPPAAAPAPAAHQYQPDAAPRRERPAPAPTAEPNTDAVRQQIVNLIEAKMGSSVDTSSCKVLLHRNKMEFTFSFAGTIQPVTVLQFAAKAGGAHETSAVPVRFLKHVMLISVPCKKGESGLEFLVPVGNGRHIMAHTERSMFTNDEIALCAALFQLVTENAQSTAAAAGGAANLQRKPSSGNMAANGAQGSDKKGDAAPKVEDMTPEQIGDELQALGVQLFMPPAKPTSKKGSPSSGEDHTQKLWATIAGYAEVKAAVQQSITLPLLRPDLFEKMSKLARGGKDAGRRSGGVLFTGPPGVGKTSIAKVAAHAACVPLVYVPVESVMSKWYGEAEQRLRRVFDLTHGLQRAVLFLDELDAFAGSREKAMHEATRRILSVLLRQLDGLDLEALPTKKAEEGAAPQPPPFLVTVGATNRPTDLDAALLSRFDVSIHFPLPTAAERAAIFENYAGALAKPELAQLGSASNGFAGRDIVEVTRQAERLWLYRLLHEQGGKKSLEMSVSELRPPPVEVYLEAIQQHHSGNAHQAS